MKIQGDSDTLNELVGKTMPHWTVETAAADYLSRKTGMVAGQSDVGEGLWEHVKAACTPAEDTLIAIEPTIAAADRTSGGMVHVNKTGAVDAEIYPDGSIHIVTDTTFR